MGLSIAQEIDLFLTRIRSLQPIERESALRRFVERLPDEDRTTLTAALAQKEG